MIHLCTLTGFITVTSTSNNNALTARQRGDVLGIIPAERRVIPGKLFYRASKHKYRVGRLAYTFHFTQTCVSFCEPDGRTS